MRGVDAKGGQNRCANGVWGIFAEYVRFENRAKKEHVKNGAKAYAVCAKDVHVLCCFACRGEWAECPRPAFLLKSQKHPGVCVENSQKQHILCARHF